MYRRVRSEQKPVREGPVGLVPVDGHVGGGVVDQVVHVVPQLPGRRSASCSKAQIRVTL